jgi:signal transduction histidine kinase
MNKDGNRRVPRQTLRCEVRADVFLQRISKQPQASSIPQLQQHQGGSPHPGLYDFKPVSLPTVIGDVLSLERPHYFNRGVRVNQLVPADLPFVIGDADKLNLCNNAVDAMANGGQLILRASSDDRHAVVEVADTGEGIPPELNIWAPFMTTKSSGTELGLTIVRNIVMAHQGTMTTGVKWVKGPRFGWRCR